MKETFVLAGVCGTDPFRVMDVFLKQLKEQGFSGVQNFPTVGLGEDILVAHMRLTTKGTIGAKTTLSLDDCVEKIKNIMESGKEVNLDIMVICHREPIAEPKDAAYVIERVEGIDGFGASSIERFAAEKGIKEQTASFKSIVKK